MKVTKAVNYGSRAVIRVCMNPDEPEWVHIIGSNRLDATGQPVLTDQGEPVLIVSAEVPPGETGEKCHNCRSNWDTREFVFDGPEFEKMTYNDLWEEVCRRCASPPVPVDIVSLLGRSG